MLGNVVRGIWLHRWLSMTRILHSLWTWTWFENNCYGARSNAYNTMLSLTLDADGLFSMFLSVHRRETTRTQVLFGYIWKCDHTQRTDRKKLHSFLDMTERKVVSNFKVRGNRSGRRVCFCCIYVVSNGANKRWAIDL